MITILKKYSRLFLLVALLPACSKQKGFGPNYSAYNPADVPVSVSNSIANRPDPTVSSSIGSDSSITITLTIPASSKHTFKAVSKIVTSSSYSAIQSSTSTAFPAPVDPATGTTFTFKTSLSTYLSVYPKEVIKVNTELANRFYFQITLDDGSIIYPTPVRVLVVS
jgi:hypothetical protein